MKLAVIWLNPTRPHDEAVRVETTYRDSLLEFFGGIEPAVKARNIHRKRQSPVDDWERANRLAAQNISGFITPTEYSQAKFIVEFH